MKREKGPCTPYHDNESKLSHTPTPEAWIEVEPKVSLEGVKSESYYVAFAGSGRCLCATKKMAEFIVRAVNSHAALNEILAEKNQ